MPIFIVNFYVYEYFQLHLMNTIFKIKIKYVRYYFYTNDIFLVLTFFESTFLT